MERETVRASQLKKRRKIPRKMSQGLRRRPWIGIGRAVRTKCEIDQNEPIWQISPNTPQEGLIDALRVERSHKSNKTAVEGLSPLLVASGEIWEEAICMEEVQAWEHM